MHTIEFEFSEVDRQTADDFCETGSCLIATTLMNRGYNVMGVGVHGAELDTGYYQFDNGKIGCGELHVKHFGFFGLFKARRPFYSRHVVGRKFSMTCQEYTPPETQETETHRQHPVPEVADKFGEPVLSHD